MAYHPFASVEELAAHMNGAVRLDDPRLPGVLAAASKLVRNYCRWHIAPVVTETVKVDGVGGVFITLPTLRLSEVTSVSSDGVVLDPTTYWPSGSGGIMSSSYLTYLPAGIEATITHGYPIEDVPEVTAIVLQAAARALASPVGYVREQTGTVGVAPTSTGVNAAGGVHLLDHEKGDLAEYRIVTA